MSIYGKDHYNILNYPLTNENNWKTNKQTNNPTKIPAEFRNMAGNISGYNLEKGKLINLSHTLTSK